MEEFKVEIASGGYSSKKEFKKSVILSDRQYVALVTVVLDFVDNLPELETIK